MTKEVHNNNHLSNYKVSFVLISTALSVASKVEVSSMQFFITSPARLSAAFKRIRSSKSYTPCVVSSRDSFSSKLLSLFFSYSLITINYY